MLDNWKFLDKNRETVAATAVVLAAVLSGPLVEEIRDVFGTPVMYHPVTVWIVLFCIVFAQSKSFQKSILVVLGYEAIKYLWRLLRLEPPKVARVRKILHNVNTNAEMSENDVRFLNNVTPKDVVVSKKS